MGLFEKSDDYVFRNKIMAYLLKKYFVWIRKWFLGPYLQMLFGKMWLSMIPSDFTGGKGRFERWGVGTNHEFLFVGAHNIDGIRKLTEALKVAFFDHVLLSFSKRNKKDILDSLSHLATYPCLYKSISLTFFDHEKALKKETEIMIIMKIKF